MGRKTNPNILRIGNILHNWDAKWFSDDPKEFSKNLLQDIQIRNYLKKNLRSASISRLEIVRQARETVLTIHTSRPAVVIGRGGSGIEKIQKDLQKMFGKTLRYRINVQEIRNPDTDAAAVATQVVDQIERRMPYRRVLKQTVGRSMQAGARGVRIAVAGRLNGADIARREWLADGNVPLHTFRADISYATKTAFTTFGTIGVKVWINRGEYAVEKEEKVGETIGTPKETKAAPRRRASLAEKVTK
ncbi:MAG: 30S ribosomal protein S3 [Candidatus Andersenbacteria bacterium RIFCSPHIGHO2_02_FULL_45_11]|uniref:Small ribosomal subunit protein uS3 n=1 Tax=Candidatus Andersenbacteria bacterium RIFCSPHIGHO2_12_FULL_45_11 TaxID=1797281 RepID=A0A1G1X323_9BACT|nr:MAG: 30S ribosomal protein S3 [Candidatus Andersenbacteria bacterium RIFCSPHIGHO2_01_FULL_46_36]OGY34383.1 MAG: 30S ribosomal protein S3 [Candidatus Andersenbacteria bacterium RIFCSPHIGHO2_12_FULL_45_11]OGY34961.1 MAG: 30S ribosomal protein S3 [Candidatus Andersenbacteria bacterium RIFCSPHIGHO2_02_FULL_45_11]